MAIQTKVCFLSRGRRESSTTGHSSSDRRRSSRKYSVVSGSSIYYSYDSDDDEEYDNEPQQPSKTLEMVTLGQRWVSYYLSFMDKVMAMQMFRLPVNHSSTLNDESWFLSKED